MQPTFHHAGQPVYRREIDGLRALAVVAVIINHFNSELLPSGYLGVDVFFVISGFVITQSLYYRRYSSLGDLLGDFYVRRVKRLVPALLVFVLVTGVLLSLFNPDPSQSLKTGLMSLFGLSNIYLQIKATDYFGGAAHLNAFTHTWSLGVEEQFYLLFPFIIWLTGFGRKTPGVRAFVTTLGLISLISLAGFIYWNHIGKHSFYFFTPTRFWELAAGSLIFVLSTRVDTRRIAGLATPLLVMLVASLWLAQENAAVATVLVVALCSLFILCSTNASSASSRLLCNRAVVYIGLISYSLYLWHWSVLSLSRWTVGISAWTAPAQIGLMLLLAVLSYHYIETPLRKATWSKHRLVSIGYGMSSACIASALVAFIAWPMNGRLYAGDRPNMAAIGVESLVHEYVLPDARYRWKGEPCVLADDTEVGKVIPLADCTLGDFDTAETRMLVLGNSFAASLVAAFDQLVTEDGFAVTITSSWGASPVREVPNTGEWSEANDYYWQVVAPGLMDRLRPGDWVFIASDLASFSPAAPSETSEARLTQLKTGIESLSVELQGRGVKLAVLHGNPFAREARCDPAEVVPQWYAPEGRLCAFLSRAETLKRRARLDETMRDLAQRRDVVVVDLIDVFCPGQTCNYRAANGEILYRDAFSHPSVEAARLSGPMIRRRLAAVTEQGMPLAYDDGNAGSLGAEEARSD
ncbi:Peptidoglycan/LPS O-acetylase OafA/YrhL, contains acyltransferase and SGNH-hydrolase domains [Halopseudomonas xinjiangensis]|uniref:Peptidoglycan/LPS O-acetylase OafA/YrhL, contains acyltransferase and SGNH-hydrolase domains n=1 Tax=Halopseudomonas xinjiangensis TaxID=487184 RepID=A0A1H1WEU8_9GAMM|nr:acyltransferase family protein [Halopseudomonas xinjiangensis]SDS94679.1 Peptidoglycan/LPS O-acetylase OafA/YrhL, contains acyltransferase and SGNH-hydrolase domains [Halopseudomonas xinjiangensis]